MLLVDATTAQHARGIRTVVVGILRELACVASPRTVVTAGPDLDPIVGLRLRRLPLARTRPGRLIYQRLLLPLDATRLNSDEECVDRVLLLDSYVPVLRPHRNVRYASLVHDTLPLTHPHFWPLAKRLVKRIAFESLRHSGATLFTSSQYNARQIEHLLGLHARVIRFGCGQLTDAEADEARRSPLPQQEPYFVYIGAIEPRKDVLSLLDAFELTNATLGTDLGLTIVGDGPAHYVAAVRAKVDRSRHRQRIRLVPQADRETALQLLSDASALVFPTLAEGFGLPILEALALGTPVVASDLPEIRAWAGEAILYAPPARPAEWVEPIVAAIGTDVTRRRAGQDFAAGFRWRRSAQDVVVF